MRNRFSMVAAAMAMVMTGCSAGYFLAGESAVDTSMVAPGATGKAIAAILNEPMREWHNGNGVTFRLYQFSGGRPSMPGYALLMGFVAIGTVGVFEPTMSNAISNDRKLGRDVIPVRMVISYDANDVALGVFEEFDYLPADGRNPSPQASTGRR